MIIDKERFDFTCGGFATGAPASKNKVVALNQYSYQKLVVLGIIEVLEKIKLTCRSLLR